VTEVPADEVLQDRTGSDANPALLCYVRKGQNLVDTLHREIWEMEQAGTLNADAAIKGTSDVEMGAPTEPAGKDSEKMDVEMPMEQEEPLIDFQEGGQTDETKEKNSSKKTEGNLIDLDD
jgi:hypothetical protein